MWQKHSGRIGETALACDNFQELGPFSEKLGTFSHERYISSAYFVRQFANED